MNYILLLFFIILIYFFSFEIRYSPSVDDNGLAGSNYDLNYLFSGESTNKNLLIDKISGFRHSSEISTSDLSDLRSAWYRNGDSNKWNYDLIDNVHIRILIAEVLHRFDKKSDTYFKGFIINNIYSDVQSHRAYAALSIGYIGDNADVDLLIKVLLEDDLFPASQAGFGLLAMRNDLASRRLRDSLIVFCDRRNYKSIRLCLTMKKYTND